MSRSSAGITFSATPPFSPESFDRFVESLVSGKEKAGQFEDADITLHEMNVIKSMLKTYMQQIYHGRVAYPKRKR